MEDSLIKNIDRFTLVLAIVLAIIMFLPDEQKQQYRPIQWVFGPLGLILLVVRIVKKKQP